MNKILADGLSVLNVLLAVAFIVIGALVGHVEFGHTVLGIVIGIIVAMAFCGTLALFLDMRAELVELRKSQASAHDAQISALKAISTQLESIHKVVERSGTESHG